LCDTTFDVGAWNTALTKNDIAHSIDTRLDLPKSKSFEVIESLLEIIKRTLENGEDFLISGFGKFSVRDKKERMGRNLHTGEKMLLRARRGQGSRRLEF
jgi:integration host factor subunit alpha